MEERTEAIASKVTPREKIALEYLKLRNRTTISNLTRDALREKHDLDALADEAISFFGEVARFNEQSASRKDNSVATDPLISVRG